MIVTAAACQTSGSATQRTYPAKLKAAMPATVTVRTRQLAPRKRKRVATVFTGEAEIRARLPPLATVRLDATSSRAVLREQMSELVPECAIDLGLAKRA